MFAQRGSGLRRLVVTATVTVLIGTTAACGRFGGGDDEGGEEGGPVTLNMTWWGDDTRAERYNEAIDLFEKENPDIKVEGTFVDWDGYWTARGTEAAGGSLPDVMQMDLSYLREYSQNGHLLDLSPHIGEEIDLSGFDEALIGAGEVDGKQIGIPISTNTLALFINPQLAEQAGVEMLEDDYTWDDFNEWMRKVTEAGVKNADGQPVFGGGDYTGSMWFFSTWLLQQGVQPFTDDGSFNFTEDDVKTFLDLTADLRSDKMVFPASRGVQVAPLDGFHVGEQASSFTWDNFLAQYAAETGVETLEMLPLPSGPDGAKGMFWKPGMLLSAAASTDHPEEAAALIDFLLTEPEVGKIFGTSQGVRADEEQRAGMAPEPGSVDEKVIAFEEEVAAHVTEEAPLPILGFGAIEAAWIRLHEDLQYGKITVDEFVEQWFAEAELATG